MQTRRALGRSAGAIVFGVLLLAVGIYYLLRNTLGFALPELDSDAIWPIIVIAIGASILFRSWGEREG
ncbi:MAG TPA: DUF5668 domain-containing protein [Candidatus Limnocylindrales bacterium]